MRAELGSDDTSYLVSTDLGSINWLFEGHMIADRPYKNPTSITPKRNLPRELMEADYLIWSCIIIHLKATRNPK